VQKKILLVEDDGDLIELLSFNLKASRTVAPDLILLDLMLPELDGFAVCEILRRDPLTATIPIVILTAWSSELARLAVLHAGANAFLTKPFSPKRLVARVQQMIDSN
jgi:DNA-binding response OmpR family regulator